MNSTIYKQKGPLFFFLIPAFTFMTLFLYYPFFMNIINSVSHISGLGTAAQGLNDPLFTNFETMIQDANMRVALKNSMIILFCTVVFQVGIALVLALIVDNITKGAQFFRTVYFLPIVISATALGLLFNLIFLYNGGMMNQLFFGLEKDLYIDWKDQSHYLIALIAPVMWQYVGFYFVILVTGLNNISTEIYEAARIDGASTLVRIRYITLPLLRNVMCTCLVLSITGSLKVFDMPFIILPAGMPMDESWLLGTYMYHQTFNVNNVDYGSAIAIVIVVMGVAISKVANTVFKEVDY
ncbi:MAG: sugar ABC transporter permease [Eubacteriales bacterium]